MGITPPAQTEFAVKLLALPKPGESVSGGVELNRAHTAIGNENAVNKRNCVNAVILPVACHE